MATWGTYKSGRLVEVGRDYDAPADELVEVRQTFGLPTGTPQITEQILLAALRATVPPDAELTYAEVKVDWSRLRCEVKYQAKSRGLVLSLIVIAVIAALVVFGLWLIKELLYKVAAWIPAGMAPWIGFGLLIALITGAYLVYEFRQRRR